MKRICTGRIVSLSIGVVYLWFGCMKFFNDSTPIAQLAQNTIEVLSIGLIPPHLSIMILAAVETGLGALLIFQAIRVVLVISFFHILFTFSPIFLFPEYVFTESGLGFTLIGQYIFKNIIIVGCLLFLINATPKRPVGI